MAGFMAAAGAGAEAPGWPFSWWLIALLAGAVFLLFAAVHYLRRIVVGGSDKAPQGLTIEQAQQLCRKGLLSEDEYQRLRRALLREFYPGGVPEAPVAEPGSTDGQAQADQDS